MFKQFIWIRKYDFCVLHANVHILIASFPQVIGVSLVTPVKLTCIDFSLVGMQKTMDITLSVHAIYSKIYVPPMAHHLLKR